MKKIYLLLLISVFSISLRGQTVFTDVFFPELPGPLLVVGDQMYVGTFINGKLYRLNLSDPDSPMVVADFPADGPWKMVYDNLNNDIYVFSTATPFFSKIDLDLSLPITPEPLLTLSSNGLAIDNNIIYIANGDSIYTYDTEIGPSSYVLFYTDSGNFILNPTVYNNELYYAWGTAPNYNIYKIDLLDPTPQRVLVSTNLVGGTQSSHIVGNYLYLGLESANKIVKLDLTSTLPISPEVVIENPDGGVIGLANKGNTFYASESVSQNIITFEDQALNVAAFNQNSLAIYPNPTKERLYVKTINSIELNYTVYSVNGTKFKEGIYTGEIDISNLAQGLYFINLNQNGVNQIEKFVKE